MDNMSSVQLLESSKPATGISSDETLARPSPDFVPYSQFHTGVWLLSEKRPGWYYFMKKKNDHLIQNDEFKESVDPPLRDLIEFLHERNITTTPSCSGHCKSERNFAKLWDDLKADEADVRQDGLMMKEIESGERFHYRDPAYELPWTKETFIDRVTDYQQKGIVGLGVNGEIKNQLLHLKCDGITTEERDGYVFFRIIEGDGDNREKWKWLTSQVKAVFEAQDR
jgi:hypothetical protein